MAEILSQTGGTNGSAEVTFMEIAILNVSQHLIELLFHLSRGTLERAWFGSVLSKIRGNTVGVG